MSKLHKPTQEESGDHMPSIEHFRQFLVLSEYLNFSLAAESLYISQPVLSRHITALEAEYDVKLFTRTTQSVELTPAGEYLRQRLEKLVDDYDDICAGVRMIKSGFSNRLRISCPYYAIHDYLGALPELFGDLYPDIKMQYSVGDPYEAMQSLVGGKADIAIIPMYPMPHVEHLVCKEIYKEPLGVLLSTSDPLVAKDTLSLTDLKDRTFFSVSNSYFNASWNHTSKLCRDAGFTPDGPALFNQMEALIMAIRRGDGITVVGQHMRNQQSELIAYRPLTDPVCARSVSIWYDPNSENEAIDIFLKFYEEYTPKRD